MNSVIKHITHPYALETMQARRDHAHITGQPLMERPWWYEDTETGRLYHDLFGCIGWPSEVSDRDTGLPGYAAIVGVIRPKDVDAETHYNPADAKFRLMIEAETKDVPTLLAKCVDIRERYGFGIQPQLLTVWFGDPERFYQTLALVNERLIANGGDRSAILIAPPDDFYVPMIFDNYVRSFQSCMMKDKERFFYGSHDILRRRTKEFRRDDPAVLAAGGLIHSLLGRCMWMDQTQGSTVFTVEEEGV